MKECQKKKRILRKETLKKRLSERIRWRELKKRKRRDLDGARRDRSDLSWAVRCDIEILIVQNTDRELEENDMKRRRRS